MLFVTCTLLYKDVVEMKIKTSVFLPSYNTLKKSSTSYNSTEFQIFPHAVYDPTAKVSVLVRLEMTVYIATNCIDLTAAAGGVHQFQLVTTIVHCLKKA